LPCFCTWATAASFPNRFFKAYSTAQDLPRNSSYLELRRKSFQQSAEGSQ
jgi:hypothetical protein